jgi:hypothetical protein
MYIVELSHRKIEQPYYTLIKSKVFYNEQNFIKYYF